VQGVADHARSYDLREPHSSVTKTDLKTVWYYLDGSNSDSRDPRYSGFHSRTSFWLATYRELSEWRGFDYSQKAGDFRSVFVFTLEQK
jgi:hypothetical protein